MTPTDDHTVEVLLVEDDDDDAAFVHRLLTASRPGGDRERLLEVAAVEHVASLEDAREALQEADPSVVLLDLGLPDSDGVDTLEAVVETAPHLPVVVLTGRTEGELGPRAIQEGAQDYLTKGRITDEILRRSLRYAIDRHEIQREVFHANRRLALLNRIVRQDVRNDVSAIVGWGEELHEHVDGQGETSADRLLEAARHAAELADTASELVDALSMDEGIEPEPVDLGDVLDGEVERVRSRTDVELTVDVAGVERDRILVEGTPMLSSVFEQLLSNAVRHTNRDVPRVTVDVTDDPDGVTVEIADDGVGIPDAQQELLNDPVARYEDRSGISTGLYLATSVLEQIDGEIEFGDNYPRGTVVTVTLTPADADDAA